MSPTRRPTEPTLLRAAKSRFREDARDKIYHYFDTANDSLNIPKKEDSVLLNPSFNSKKYKDGLIQETILMAYGISTYKPDIRTVGRVFNAIFGGNDDSRLFMNLRDDKGLVYGVCSDGVYTFDGDIFLIQTETDPENTNKAIAAIDEEIEKIQAELVSEEDLTRAKNRLRSAEYRREESSHALCHQTLNEEFYGYYYGNKYLDDIYNVTAEEVQAFAKRIFSGERYLVIGTSKEQENE